MRLFLCKLFFSGMSNFQICLVFPLNLRRIGIHYVNLPFRLRLFFVPFLTPGGVLFVHLPGATNLSPRWGDNLKF